MRRAAVLLVVGLGCRVAGAADRGRVTLVLARRTDYRAEDVEREVLALFQWAHPGLTVEQQPSTFAQVAGRSPDVVQLEADDVPALGQSGTLLDLAPLLPRLGLDPARYDSAALAAFRRGTAIYALPQGVAPIVLAYNKDLFDRARMPYPSGDWTWEDFLHAAQLLTRDVDGDGRVDQWGTALERAPRLWISWLWSGGGDVLCPDGRRASGCLDSPASVAALRWYTDWVTQTRGIAPNADLRRSGPDNGQLFFAGKVAMLTVGSTWIPTARAAMAARHMRLGLVELPHALGAAPQTVVYPSGFAVPAAAPHRRLSVELAAYLADSQAQRIRAPAASDSLDWDEVVVAASRHGRAPWGSRVARWRDVEAVLAGLMDQLTLTRVDAAVAAHAMALRLDQVLAAGAAR